MRIKPSLTLGTELYFGPGCVRELPEIIKPLGARALLVTGTGRTADLARKSLVGLAAAGIAAAVSPLIEREPELAMVEAVIAEAREYRAEVIVGFGGGSCLDAAKAAAGILADGPGVRECFAGAKLTGTGLPWVAVPTTAGSGAEVTPNAVLIDPDTGIKQSIRSERLRARAAVVDPELTVSLPPAQTVYSGMDALCHGVEALVSRGANELTDVLAIEAARLIERNLERACRDGEDLSARTAMAKGSLLAGIALANARLGVAHGLAHPIGSRYHLPHGKVCAVLLPQVMRFNLQVSYEKYALLAEAWGLSGGEDVIDRAAAVIRHIIGMNRRLGIPRGLARSGLVREDFTALTEQAMPSGSLAANPRPACRDDLLAILESLCA